LATRTVKTGSARLEQGFNRCGTDWARLTGAAINGKTLDEITNLTAGLNVIAKRCAAILNRGPQNRNNRIGKPRGTLTAN
jgi:hypothetical protein